MLPQMCTYIKDVAFSDTGATNREMLAKYERINKTGYSREVLSFR